VAQIKQVLASGGPYSFKIPILVGILAVWLSLVHAWKGRLLKEHLSFNSGSEMSLEGGTCTKSLVIGRGPLLLGKFFRLLTLVWLP
jgi:hypothetical protein